MKLNIYYNALSPHNQDSLFELLNKQLAENETQLNINGVLTPQEISSLISRNKDLIGLIYEIERYNNHTTKNIKDE